ncbi:MAG: hypothetical protein RB292_03550 [Patescibacteria group bacterium]|jgi:hypothetical protein|nr:hypothetical protein [Patescibacteria group bacterium]
MKKVNFFYLTLASGLLLISGCATASQNAGNNSQGDLNNFLDQATSTDRAVRFNFEENFTITDFSQLVIGNQVVITGASNDDGSITASRIIVGAAENMLPPGLGMINSDIRPQPDQGVGSQDRQQAVAKANGQMPDFEDLTDEQREQMRSRFAQQGNSRPNGIQARTSQSSMMVQGEILKKDDTSLTIKLADGGSKLVLITGSTEILQPKE